MLFPELLAGGCYNDAHDFIKDLHSVRKKLNKIITIIKQHGCNNVL